MTYKGITISTQDLVYLAALAVSTVLGLIAHSKRSPAWLRDWSNRIGGMATIQGVITSAETFAAKSPDEKRLWAADRLKTLAWKNFGVPMPTSIANALVEIGYQEYKQITTKRSDQQ